MSSKYHVRSNSFPSQSHPSSTRIEQELTKMKTWEATSTSTSDSITTGLSFLEDLYISLEDLLNMSSTQKAISHHHGEKFVEELLDGSVKVLDICGITRDTGGPQSPKLQGRAIFFFQIQTFSIHQVPTHKHRITLSLLSVTNQTEKASTFINGENLNHFQNAKSRKAELTLQFEARALHLWQKATSADRRDSKEEEEKKLGFTPKKMKIQG
ncbi:DUF241 domain protein [Medicago truncatula]|uniref:DUF241 domain protein n=1 Tax=Medicago truncatula TaxID=3880 RepID=G7JYV6_MEDTR|nr:DUF241 domain protein [Medicago truncatula]